MCIFHEFLENSFAQSSTLFTKIVLSLKSFSFDECEVISCFPMVYCRQPNKPSVPLVVCSARIRIPPFSMGCSDFVTSQLLIWLKLDSKELGFSMFHLFPDGFACTKEKHHYTGEESHFPHIPTVNQTFFSCYHWYSIKYLGDGLGLGCYRITTDRVTCIQQKHISHSSASWKSEESGASIAKLWWGLFQAANHMMEREALCCPLVRTLMPIPRAPPSRGPRPLT